MANPLRREVRQLYKNLLYLGREYPQGADYFRERLNSAFMKNKDVTDPKEIRKLVDCGEVVIKELGTLYYLREYSAMKKRFYEEELLGLLNIVKAATVSGSDMANPLRREVRQLYKNLLFLGREYPKGADYFRERLKSAFMKNKDVTDPKEIKKLVDRGEFVIKELEALYYLRKYRAMKKRYYEEEMSAVLNIGRPVD